VKTSSGFLVSSRKLPPAILVFGTTVVDAMSSPNECQAEAAQAQSQSRCNSNARNKGMIVARRRNQGSCLVALATDL
jgi:hypothetical protein